MAVANKQPTKKELKEAEIKLARAKAREKAAKAKLKAAEHRRKVAEKTQLAGFMDFVRTQGVVGLAIGIVLGTQVKAVTDQLVASFINPFLGLILPGTGSLSEKSFALTLAGNTQNFTYGAFLSVIISFIAIAAVVYYVIKGLGLDKLDKKKD